MFWKTTANPGELFFSKNLSMRRIKSIFAFLTRDACVWMVR